MFLQRIKSFLQARQEILGINARNLDLIYTHNDRKYFINVDDKILCKSLLAQNGIPTPATYHVISGPGELAEWGEKILGVDEFVIKPNKSFGGQGIILIHRKDSVYRSSDGDINREEIDFHIKQILNGAFSLDNTSDIAFLEQRLHNHQGIKTFLPPEIDGVADIRLIYQLERPVMAMIRIPTRESGGKANLHQGGIGIGIDLSTGKTLDGCYRNDIISTHPETGLPLAGMTIPFFAEMLGVGSRISEIVKLGYIGVDFVVDESAGPMVLEVNARPGLNIQIANQCGLKERLV